jgi:hypothetical protein
VSGCFVSFVVSPHVYILYPSFHIFCILSFCLKYYCSLVILFPLVTYQKVSHAKLVLSHLEKLQLCFSNRKENSLLDSLDWSRKFEILSVSRLDLSSYGLTTEQINRLSDADMEAIAERIRELVVIEPIEKIVEFVTRLYLAEKGTTGECIPKTD